MGILVDIIVIAIIALSVFLGYRKGLIALAIKLFAVIIALVATLILYKPISALIINNTSLDETIQNAIIDKVETNNQDTEQNNENTNSTEPETTVETIANQAKEEILPETAKELSINIILCNKNSITLCNSNSKHHSKNTNNKTIQ